MEHVLDSHARRVPAVALLLTGVVVGTAGNFLSLLA
jgi:hypothetical protein